MADKDDVVVDEAAAEEVQDEQVQEPESMDDIIEKEAEAELEKERGEEDGQEAESDESESSEDDDADADAEGEESDEADESEQESEEEVEESEDEEEAEPIDKTSFSEVGLEAVPDDYKPENWKSFLADAVEVIRGEVNKESRALGEQQQAFQQEVSKVDEGWQSEIAELQKAKELPSDEKELQAATKEVFEFMAENNKKYESNPNKQIWSFETAYKLKNATKVTGERAEEIKNRRKARASATAGSGNSEGGSGIPRATKGESMDDIIARELNL